MISAVAAVLTLAAVPAFALADAHEGAHRQEARQCACCGERASSEGTSSASAQGAADAREQAQHEDFVNRIWTGP